MRGMELSLAMIRSVTVTLHGPTLCWDTGKPLRMLMQASPPPEPTCLLSLLASHPTLTHPATNSLAPAVCTRAPLRAEDPAGNKSLPAQS